MPTLFKRRRRRGTRKDWDTANECFDEQRKVALLFLVITVVVIVCSFQASPLVFDDFENNGARMLQQEQSLGVAFLSSASGNVVSCTITNGVQICPITEAFIQDNGFGGNNIVSMQADISCPLESVDQLGFRQSSRDGRCSCNVTGYAWESNPDLFGTNGQAQPLPSGCECYVCPYGDGLQLAEFKCDTALSFTLTDACTSFNCEGVCNKQLAVVEQPISFICPANALGEDPCPSQDNGVCDSAAGDDPFSGEAACITGDCIDCDLCRIYDYDCGSCLSQVGCSWCPFEGICTNSPNLASNDTQYPLCIDSVEAPGNISQCSAPEAPFSDPLASAQNWVFDQIDLLPVWNQGLFGNGIRVRINDDGLDQLAPELIGRFSANASCIGGASEPLAPENGHGTAVAAVLGGTGSNSECAVGVAPNVTFSFCNVVTETGNPQLAFEINSFDISQNALGKPACAKSTNSVFQGPPTRRRYLQGGTCPFLLPGAAPCTQCVFTTAGAIGASSQDTCGDSIVEHCATNFKAETPACTNFLDLILGGGSCEYNRVPESVLKDLSEGVTNGRGGKGVIYVVPSGDDNGIGGDINFNGLANSIMTITVGAVRKNDLHSSYSTPGAPLLVSAPGGDKGDISNHVTPLLDGSCTGDSIGTSFASAVVSGVVALILEANPALSWREVQGVLAETARPVMKDSRDPSRIRNGAGLTHSNFYGFGVVNATAAVTIAKNWTKWCLEEVVIGESGLINISLLDDPAITVNQTITIRSEQAKNLVAESVAVLLNIRHFSRGDLEITLTSPAGTDSVLHPGRRPETSQLGEEELWNLTTVRNWGESIAGEWKLAIRDLRSGDLATCSDVPFNITVFGVNYNCTDFSELRICSDGSPDAEFFATPGNAVLLEKENGGFTLDTACCVCGGGFRSTSFEDELVQWRLVVYGHLEDCSITAPTLTPIVPDSSGPVVPGSMVDKEERLATITATAIAFLLIALVLWGSLRDPTKKSENVEETNPESNKGKPRIGGWRGVLV